MFLGRSDHTCKIDMSRHEPEEGELTDTEDAGDEEGAGHPELMGTAVGAIAHYASQLIGKMKSAQMMAGKSHGEPTTPLPQYPNYIGGPLGAAFPKDVHEDAIEFAARETNNWRINLLNGKPHGLRAPFDLQPVKFSDMHCKTLVLRTPQLPFASWLTLGQDKAESSRGTLVGQRIVDFLGGGKLGGVDGMVPLHVCIQEGGAKGFPDDAGVPGLGVSVGTTAPGQLFRAWSKSQVVSTDPVTATEQKALESTAPTAAKPSVNVLMPTALMASLGSGGKEQMMKDAPRVPAGETGFSEVDHKRIQFDSAFQPVVPYKRFEEDGLVFVADRSMFHTTPEAALLLSVRNLPEALERGVRDDGNNVIISGTDSEHPGYAPHLSTVIALNHIHELLDGREPTEENLRDLIVEESSGRDTGEERASVRLYIRAPRRLWRSIVHRYVRLFSRHKHVMEVTPETELAAMWTPYAVGGRAALSARASEGSLSGSSPTQTWVAVKILYRTIHQVLGAELYRTLSTRDRYSRRRGHSTRRHHHHHEKDEEHGRSYRSRSRERRSHHDLFAERGHTAAKSQKRRLSKSERDRRSEQAQDAPRDRRGRFVKQGRSRSRSTSRDRKRNGRPRRDEEGPHTGFRAGESGVMYERRESFSHKSAAPPVLPFGLPVTTRGGDGRLVAVKSVTTTAGGSGFGLRHHHSETERISVSAAPTPVVTAMPGSATLVLNPPATPTRLAPSADGTAAATLAAAMTQALAPGGGGAPSAPVALAPPAYAQARAGRPRSRSRSHSRSRSRSRERGGATKRSGRSRSASRDRPRD